jgi:hypothetical protein
MPCFDLLNRFPQWLDISHQQVIAIPLQKVNGKEISAAFKPNSSAIHFLPSLLCCLNTAQCPLVIAPYGLGVSTINPFTSGGGGGYGVNFEYTSDAGWHVYSYGTPNNQCSSGFELGASATFNYAFGNGEWTGPFEQVDTNIGLISFGQFDSPGGTFQNGYYGGQFGLGVGAPYGVGQTVTNYSLLW